MRIYRLGHIDSSSIEPHLLRTLKPHSSPVLSSAIDATGSLLATGASDGIVKVWDIERGYTTHTFSGHGGLVTALRFFQVDFVEAEDASVKASKSRKKRRQSELEQESAGSEVTTGYRLASGDENGQVRVWNLLKRTCAASLNSHGTVVHCLDYDPEQRLLMTGSRDKTVILWDAVAWKPRNTIPTLEAIEAGGFLSSGSLFFTGGEAGRLKIWDSRSGSEVTAKQEAGGEEQSIKHLIYHTGLPFILSAHTSHTLTLHSLTPLDDYTPGTTIAPLPLIRQLSGTHDEIIDLAYVGPNRDYLAIATNLEEVRILSLASTSVTATTTASNDPPYFGADVASLTGHTGIVICLDVDWSGHWLVTGAKDSTARLWRLDPVNSNFSLHTTFTGHAEAIGAVALPRHAPPPEAPAHLHPLEHPPAFILTGSQDKTIKRWDALKPARAAYTRKAHDKDINALDVSHDGSLFASASQDRTVKLFATATGEAVAILRGHRRGVWTVRFSPRAVAAIAPTNTTPAAAAVTAAAALAPAPTSSARGYLVTGSGDKTLKIWSLADYTCLRTLEGHSNSVLKAVWLPPPPPPTTTDARAPTTPTSRIASAAGDGLVKIWDASTGELATTLDNHTDRVWALAATPSSPTQPHTLLSGGADGVLTFWRDTTTTTLAAHATRHAERTEAEQSLSNALRAGDHRRALGLALALNHPARLLALFSAAAATNPPEPASLTGSAGLDAALAELSDGQLLALLRRLRDWNAAARSAPVAQRVLAALLRTFPPARFARLAALGRGTVGAGEGADGAAAGNGDGDGDGSKRRGKAGGGDAPVGAVLEALAAYTARHYRRAEELLDESYLVEYTLREMDEVAGAAGGVVAV